MTHTPAQAIPPCCEPFRPYLLADFANSFFLISRTAEIAANSPRYRRRSSTFIDGVHDVEQPATRAPAQLYSTESGRLFHSGRIVIVLVGPPARGKTYVSLEPIYIPAITDLSKSYLCFFVQIS